MNIFLIEVKSPYSIDLAKEIEKNGDKITHITSSENSKSAPRILNNSETKVISSQDLFSSKVILKKYSNYMAPLTKDILQAFQTVERDFYILTDRSNSRPVSFRTRKLLFNDLIRFWIGYLRSENIDGIYFPYTPHAGWDLVLMRAAQYLKIPYCYLSHTAINNRSMLRTSYEILEKVPHNYLENSNVQDLRNHIKPQLLKDFDEESVVTSVVKLQNDMFQKQTGTKADTQRYKEFYDRELKKQQLQKYIKTFKNTARSFLEFIGVKEPIYRFATFMNKHHPLWGWELQKIKHKFFASNLKTHYEKLSQTPDLKKPYIYFPLHLQPELTSQPEAGFFEDQYLALETLILALPAGWKIYLKENPRQFDTGINTVSAMHFRDIDDLNRFSNHPEVLIVPQNIKSEDLIKNAKVTATLTGTAGWESLNVGKPCITFARPWYSPCQSCYVVENAREIKNALNEIENKSEEIVEKDILKYLAFYSDILIVATLHAPSDVSYNSRPYGELIEKHAKAIIEFFQKKKAKTF